MRPAPALTHRSLCLRAAALAAVVLLSLGCRGLAAQGAGGPQDEEAALLKILASEAPLFDKAKACQRLAVVGTGKAVPALAGLLKNPELAHYARFGLEPIPDPAVDEALRASLAGLDGSLLAGAVNSIGVRRDAQALGALTALLQHQDGEVAAAAAAALGRIGGPEAAAVLQSALAKAPAPLREALAEACFPCGESLLALGKGAAAAELFDAVRAAEVPARLRLRATRWAILVRGAAGIPLLVRNLQAEDGAAFALALGVARELPADAVTPALAAALGTLPPERQALTVQAMADCGGPAALPAILGAARSGPAVVRRAAVTALGALGDPSALPVLLEAAAGDDPDLAREAVESMTRLRGKEVDAAILGLLESGEGRTRLAAIQVAGRRRLDAALPAIRKATTSSDEGIRLAAIATLGEAMGASDVPFLAERLAAAPSAKETEALIAALQAAARRAPDKDAYAAMVIAAQASAAPETTIRFLEALRAVGGVKASQAVAAQAKGPDLKVRAEAIAILGRWPDEAGPRTLIDFVKATDDPEVRLAALRGWCDRVRTLRFSKEARLALCKEGLELARTAEERKVAILACRGIPAVETMDLLIPLLADPAIKEDACQAIVGMGQRIIRFQPEAVVRGMRSVLATTVDPGLRKTAGQLLRNAGGGGG